ncbi:MAG TPA: DUF58 domain-containing protein [Gemmatimonadaceae bacterium]|jgi:uncharacterized protein (DUF58 family)|nr:DUF58 domain-containing protein [Gemmatimonadaceae bacterium]
MRRSGVLRTASWRGETQTHALPHPDAPRRTQLGVPPEILRQVKLLELRTRGLVNSLFSGEYRSVFKGQGMEFSEVREYQAGDEVRSIDWNVTARMRRPYVKRYIEERELTVMLAVDLSGSERFGTRRRFKSELASELAAVLAMSAIRNNDRVGTLLFTDKVEHVVPPRKGRRHALRLMRDLLAFEPEHRGTDVALATDYLNKMLAHKTIIFMVSDFMAPSIEHPLKLLAQRHDVVAVTVEDPSELELPDIGLARLTDPETGETVDVDTSDPEVRTAYAESVNADREARKKLFRRLAIDEVPVRTDGSIVEPLFRFFRNRETRVARR